MIIINISGVITDREICSRAGGSAPCVSKWRSRLTRSRTRDIVTSGLNIRSRNRNCPSGRGGCSNLLRERATATGSKFSCRLRCQERRWILGRQSHRWKRVVRIRIGTDNKGIKRVGCRIVLVMNKRLRRRCGTLSLRENWR